MLRIVRGTHADFSYRQTVKITAMAEDDFTIDYVGARGSNAGDEYHELWAVRHALRLLDEHTPLSAMTVEGLRAEDGTGPSGTALTARFSTKATARRKPHA